MTHILIVGYGNTCRSPIAERLLGSKLPGRIVRSAGLNAVIGARADPSSQMVARAHGLDLRMHASEPVADWMCAHAQLIRVMDRGLACGLERCFAQARNKTFRLGDEGDFDVVDPYCQTGEMFQKAFDQIERGVEHWAPRIRRMRC